MAFNKILVVWWIGKLSSLGGGGRKRSVGTHQQDTGPGPFQPGQGQTHTSNYNFTQLTLPSSQGKWVGKNLAFVNDRQQGIRAGNSHDILHHNSIDHNHHEHQHGDHHHCTTTTITTVTTTTTTMTTTVTDITTPPLYHH